MLFASIKILKILLFAVYLSVRYGPHVWLSEGFVGSRQAIARLRLGASLTDH